VPLLAYQCITLSGDPRGPGGCPPGICDEEPQRGACCDIVGECMEALTLEECEGIGGEWRGPDVACSDVICIEEGGCREPNEPYYNDGDKIHSLDMCGTAVVGLTKVLPEHASADYPAGCWRFVTMHETRNTKIPEPAEPCRLHWLDLLVMEDGSLVPAMCSNQWEHAKYNLGFLTRADEGTLDQYAEPGQYPVVVGVENERLWTAQFRHWPHLCGVYS